MFDSLGKKIIKALEVKCDNAERGCKWEGTIGTLEEHDAKTMCEFTPVPCPKECRLNYEIRMITRKDLDEHLRKQCPNREYECKHCGMKDTYTNIVLHENKCEEKPFPCPNANAGCRKLILRTKISEHVENDCGYAVISCKYEKIGCDVKVKRIEMRPHEKDEKAHFHQAVKTVDKLRERLQLSSETIASMKKERNDVASKLKKQSEDMVDKLKSAMEQMESNEKDDTAVTLKSIIEQITLINELNKEIAVKLESTVVPVKRTFKITEYEKKTHTRGVFHSQSFYSSIDGYKMSIGIDPSGSGAGKGTHVSVLVDILKGDHDDNLDWPFIGTFSIELLNQLEDDNHYCKTVNFTKEQNKRAGSNLGYGKFIPHSELSHNPFDNTQYLKDDTLYFRVSVEVSGHKPWLECTL